MPSNSPREQMPTRPKNDRVAMRVSELTPDIIAALRNVEPGPRSEAAERSLRELERREALIPR